MKDYPVVIVGAGPAGLTAAYELTRRGIQPLVLEKGDKVGGISRTEAYKGYRFDIGGHRFYTKVAPVQELWEEIMGDAFLKRPRLSRIYYRERFFSYPLEPLNALSNMGLTESVSVVWSYLQAKVRPSADEETFEQWVTNRFGRKLYETFFKTYTEKVWGIPCNVIQADFAAQRIRGLSLTKAVTNAFFGSNNVKTLIREFNYPSLGPGMLWESAQAIIEQRGGEVRLNAETVAVNRDGNRVKSVHVRQDGQTYEIPTEHLISSMPLNHLVLQLDQPAPAEALQAARRLSHRSIVVVGLILNRDHLFPDNWIYVHSPEVRVGRIQNFGNWSPAMVPDPATTSLGMEYFCSEGDDIWNMPDAELIALAAKEIEALRLAQGAQVIDGVVFRQPKAYPVYDRGYREQVQVIRSFMDTMANLQTIGRNGMHRYNNQDHSMLTGMWAARNVFGENLDLWRVNADTAYQEEFAKG